MLVKGETESWNGDGLVGKFGTLSVCWRGVIWEWRGSETGTGQWRGPQGQDSHLLASPSSASGSASRRVASVALTLGTDPRQLPAPSPGPWHCTSLQPPPRRPKQQSLGFFFYRSVWGSW